MGEPVKPIGSITPWPPVNPNSIWKIGIKTLLHKHKFEIPRRNGNGLIEEMHRREKVIADMVL